MREQGVYRLFHLLRTCAKVLDPATLALGTGLWHRGMVVAVVTDQKVPVRTLSPRCRDTVEREGHLTAWTLYDVTTVAAHHKRGCATAVQKQDHLLSIG